MGKDWKGKDGHRGGGGGRGGGRGGGGGGNSNDLSSCRGYAAVIGTCDAARERESSKELCNLLTQAIEKLGLSKEPEVNGADAEEENAKVESIEDMLRNEVLQLKNQSKRGAQDVVSIQTGIKGIVFVKISRRDVCPVQLVKSVFDQITIDKVPCSRHLVKMIPLQLAFFAGEEDFVDHMKTLVEGTFVNPGSITLPRLQLNRSYKRKAAEVEAAAAEALNKTEDAPNDEEPPLKKACIDTEAGTSESTEDMTAPKEVATEVPEEVAATATLPEEPVVAEPTEVKPEIKYLVLFKARNHNILNKGMVLQHTRTMMPRHVRQDYMLGKNVVIVEALKNIAGISYFPDYFSYNDLNLRKHQAQHCVQATSSMLSAAPADSANLVPLAQLPL